MGYLIIPVFVFIAFVGFLGYGIGYESATKTERAKAISANVAKWTIDPKTGKREFVYSTP